LDHFERAAIKHGIEILAQKTPPSAVLHCGYLPWVNIGHSAI
jgi:hypothetical protein